MSKSIFTYYKERLIEIGGSNKCLYLKSIVRRGTYDIGRIFEGRDEKVSQLVDFLWGSSKAPVLSLLSKAERDEIVRNIQSQQRRARAGDTALDAPQPDEAAAKRLERTKQAEANKILEGEVVKVKELRREADEIERERGRHELYIGYPFVFGCIPQGATKTLIKAPLLLFPVKIEILDDYNVEITLNKSEKIHINQALVFAYAQSKKLNIDALELELDDMSKFKTVRDVITYLSDAGIKIDDKLQRNVFSYSRFKEPEPKPELSLRSGVVLGRFPLSNSIYSDYTLLEKRNLSNDALAELLRIGKVKPKSGRPKKPKSAKAGGVYPVRMLDYAQSEVLREIEEHGNVVIYGPPGTGKSQTIVNIISDALAKRKRVLVVSQKKAALDVVFNRLGLLSERAMYISDEAREKRSFYERCHSAHTRERDVDASGLITLEAQYSEIEGKIAELSRKLDEINALLTTPRMPFGLTMSEMYSSSYNLGKNTTEYAIYLNLIKHPELMSLTYKDLTDAMFGIEQMKLAQTYYSYMQSKEKNPLIDYMKEDLDIRTLAEVKGLIEDIQRTKKGLFNTSKYPYYRQVLAFYGRLKDEESLDRIVRLEVDFQKPGFFKRGKLEEKLREQFRDTLDAIDSFAKEYECLNRVMTTDGYISVIDNILRGNVSYIKLVYDALDNYISFRDVNNLLASLDGSKLAILNFAYSTCKSYSNYLDIIAKLPMIRIYHEVLRCEEEYRDKLAGLMDFEDIASKIYRLKTSQLDLAQKIAYHKTYEDYELVFKKAKDSANYLHQINKNKGYWPIRKMVEVYSELVLTLFPCWLLSPENVSSLLPLTKNLFDLVIFDEASQIFIESTIPTIYRGKTVVVAGDDKQLRPSATFIKRYLGADPEAQEDYSMQAALEVDSLLDLAVSRYESTNLTYHYRSKNQELIDFSNAAFYTSGLQIAPNVSKNTTDRPIVRYKVEGKWLDRKNIPEAKKVVEILKQIFSTRKENESIGIITFNSEQQSAIADMIDVECGKNKEFRALMAAERHRVENGEDTSIFIKNLENVQGDERDIIIFSIGYAENEAGKVYTSFGSLSAEGGENRLNVAITRAKKKIIVVTSIEPEDLKVESAKNNGPKLLQKYLQYVRAVSDGKTDEVGRILQELQASEQRPEARTLPVLELEEQIKERLEKQGYKVDTRLGDKNNRISLAVYDQDSDRYLVGVELDRDAFMSTSSPMERDVYKPRFLEARGWTIMRIWCRDWWLSPQKVIKSITAAAERSKKKA